jgi:hypothetical protein
MASGDPTPTSQPLVSIVTPTLQRVGYLERTLRSVRAQTYPNVEHIVVDGGSTDGTLELLEHYARTYGLRWISEPDRGMYDAINKGFRLASGELLGYLNSDDLYFPWTIETVVEAFADRPDVDLVYGDAIRVDEIHQWTVPVFLPRPSGGPTATYGSLLQPCVFMRGLVYQTLNGFDDRLNYVADMEFWLRAAQRFEFARISEFLALELRHGDMLSETKRTEMAAEDDAMRSTFRHGVKATSVAKFAAHARHHAWLGQSWLEFVTAVRRGGPGWRRAIEELKPSVDALTAACGVMPSKGSRLRAGVRWGRDPLVIASDGADG